MGLLQGNYIPRGGMTQGLHVTAELQSLYQPHSGIFFPLWVHSNQAGALKQFGKHLVLYRSYYGQ